MEATQRKWYFKKSVLLLIFLSVGPLVLPLIWLSPEFSRRIKIILTIAILVLSYLAMMMTMRFVYGLRGEFQQLLQQG
ncbi:MAG: hypothetical protein WBE75_03105 [Candidatus Omnitrophota bacterium]|jgi:hypothetical protein